MLKTAFIKKDFPVLINNPRLTYLDSAATSLKPMVVIDKISEYYKEYGVNINRGAYYISHKATEEYEKTREVVAKFIGAKTNEIVFTRGTTDSLNMLALALSKTIEEGDEIIVSELEHHSSVMPWQQIAIKNKAVLKYIPLDETGRITVDNFKKVLTTKTKIIALTYISNVLGYETPLEEIIKISKTYNVKVIVDAAQAIPHKKVDVKKLDVDFLAFSAHKMLGPTGVGVLYGKYHLLNQLEPSSFGGDMNDGVELYEATFKDAPFKFEAGTPNIAGIIAFKEAVNYLNQIGLDQIEAHVKALALIAYEELSKIPNVIIYNKHINAGIIAFNFKGVHPHDAATFFDQEKIALRAGHHCAQLATNWLKCNGTLRASFYLYNDASDVLNLVNAVKEASVFFQEWSDE